MIPISSNQKGKETKKGFNKLFLIIAAVAVIMIALYLFGNQGEIKPIDKETIDVPLAETSAKIKGNDSALVKVVEYADFECSACAAFYKNTLPTIEKIYVEKGKIQMEYKHYPLESIHRQALPAAMASECAREQGAFWQYHDVLFENQALLRESSYKTWAERLGLDAQQFNQCYDSGKYKNLVKAEAKEASDRGIRSTPTFTVNGRIVESQRALQNAIEEELAKQS